MGDRSKRRTTVGIVLILVGLGFLVQQEFSAFDSRALLMLLGLLFLTAYLWSRRYGLMVPAGILVGLGSGEVLDDAVGRFADGEQLALGLGFLLVFLVPLAYQRRSHWWPLIPGGALVLLAVERTQDLVGFVFENWPATLILIGAIMVLAGWLGRGKSSASD